MLQVNIEWQPSNTFYLNVINNKSIVTLFEKNATNLGIKFSTDERLLSSLAGSTDMGNVSYEVPSIHPMFSIGTMVMNHTRPFTAAAGRYIYSKYM